MSNVNQVIVTDANEDKIVADLMKNRNVYFYKGKRISFTLWKGLKKDRGEIWIFNRGDIKKHLSERAITTIA